MSPLGATRVHLVRHGRVHNPEGVLYGRLPGFALDEEGREQARRAGRALGGEPLAAVFASPMLRARQTAQALVRLHEGLELRVSRLLHEVRTPFEGCSAEEARRVGEDFYSGAGAGFEQPRDVVGRVRRFFRRVLREFPGTAVAAVTHGDPIAFAVLWACGREPSPRDKARLAPCGVQGGYPAPGSITTFTFDRDAPDGLPRVDHRRP